MRGLVLLVAIIAAGCGATSSGPSGPASPAPTVDALATGQPIDSAAPLPSIVRPTSYAKVAPRDWLKIVKAPDNYVGRGLQVWACITQFDAATGEDTFRANASYRKEADSFSGDNALFTADAGKLSDYVQGDEVFVNAVGMGSFSYDTQIGGNTTVPMFYIAGIAHKGSCQ